jgi:hypothetical protein
LFRKIPEKCSCHRNSGEGGEFRKITAKKGDGKIPGRFGRFSRDFAIITFGFDAVKEHPTTVNGNICCSCGKSMTKLK